jgi:hypothetical protein
MKAVTLDAFSIWLMAKKLKGWVARRTCTHSGSIKIKMNTAPRRSPRIAAQMAAAAPAPVAAQQPLRRSARIAARTQSYPSHGVSPSHWAKHRAYTGLTWDQCRKLDKNIARVYEYLSAVDLDTCLVTRAELVIRLIQYLYHNDLLVLRNPKFRATVTNKLEEILNSTSMARITPTQRRILRTQKLWTYKYREMTSHPLYVA